MSIVLQVSDPHFGTERAPVVRALQVLAADVVPDVVVLSGDITQRARRGEFAAARAFVERMAAPALLAIPGNHDIPLFNLAARALRPYGAYARTFGVDLEPSYESADLLVLCVNTTRAHRHKNGEISAEQIARIAERLGRAAPQKLRIVVTHHPMHVPIGPEERNLLRGHADAARAWASAGADLVMGGHIHLPFVRPMSERVPDLSRALWVVQAGTAVSRRVRRDGGEANSVNLVRYDAATNPRLCIVERWDHDAGQGKFRLAHSVPIPLQR